MSVPARRSRTETPNIAFFDHERRLSRQTADTLNGQIEANRDLSIAHRDVRFQEAVHPVSTADTGGRLAAMWILAKLAYGRPSIHATLRSKRTWSRYWPWSTIPVNHSAS